MENRLKIPDGIGRAIVETGAAFCCPLLRTDAFIGYARDRGLHIDRKRLILIERLRRFAPVFRVKTPTEDVPHLRIPPDPNNDWFERGWAFDTSLLTANYTVPDFDDDAQDGYYSIFQLDELNWVLAGVTVTVQLDCYLEPGREPEDWNEKGQSWLNFARRSGAAQYRRGIALLCQYISERYWPATQSDERRMEISRSHMFDKFVILRPHDNWEAYALSWNPKTASDVFQLTPDILRGAFETLAAAQASVDPISNWHQLVQFVALDERRRLKGDALLAETIRSGANMLRDFYKELYGDELPVPNEVMGTIIKPIPELSVRQDTRRFLEFVANRYHLNPQPLVVIFVEGPTEKYAIELIFEKYAGTHPGKYGIEIIVLGGVDPATGTKEDRFRAIFRLIDYLHHHQTLTYLLLDNEGYAQKLQSEAGKAVSIHSMERLVTDPDRIELLKISLEFDNFSDGELADAMTILAAGKRTFVQTELTVCRNSNNPGAALKALYRGDMGIKLDKMKLVRLLFEKAVDPAASIKITDRPLFKTLEKITGLATRNPLPTMQEIWEINQRSGFLGKLKQKKRP